MNLKSISKKMWIRIGAIALAAVVAVTVLLVVLLNGKNDNPTGKKKDSIVIMTEELSGLFNPFYATAGTDMDVVGMTQIGMLSTNDKGEPVAGDDEPTVVKDFEVKIVGTDPDEQQTVYTFVIKNGLKFSDGKPLTMNDVFFNMYELLDPVYTGSSTMYSIDIVGLTKYRTQQDLSDDSNLSEQISSQAAGNAYMRILELVDVYELNGEKGDNSYEMTDSQMRSAIANWGITDGYMAAVSTEKEQLEWTEDDYRAILLEDYELTLKTFREELEGDFKAAKESFDLETMPYSEHKNLLQNDIFKFFLYEGLIQPEYNKIAGKTDRTKILRFTGLTDVSNYTEESAITRVFNDKTKYELNQVLTYWGTAGTLRTIYTAAATDVILQGYKKDDGSLQYPNIEGIVSLGHTTNTASIKVNGSDYAVAQEHKADGTPKNSNEYDVLQITVDGTDPKAIYNFGFTVAPAHYYASRNGKGTDVNIDIANNKFGVEYASSDFQSKVIQSQRNVEVPMGAGPYKATDENNSDNPTGTSFWSSNIIYYKANDNFMFDVKADKIRYQVVSPSNAIDKLVSGEVDYIEPQFTKANADRLTGMKKDGYVNLDSWQLGYGYIGINAGKVPNVNVRRAIMCAMETQLACQFYAEDTCATIDWPMSRVSWAYPFEDDGKTSKPNKSDYTQWTGVEDAKDKIAYYMQEAGVSANDSQLKIKFTIAGASITEHPTYTVFKQAAEILNDMGWQVEVKADSQALTKLATGSLEVWAAAWGSTIDPDMYQVYHKNSSASSVFAWGYREIKADASTYEYEQGVINNLSDIIDYARSIMREDKTEEQNLRKAEYEKAMQLVLDLAVEMPVYQRKTLYAYNGNTIKGLKEQVNPYSSPLEKIWEIELKNN